MSVQSNPGLLRSVIGPENSCHSLNQLDRTWSPAFFRALGSSVVFFYFEFSLALNGISLSSDWQL